MSGGHFDYQQYHISDIVESIQAIIDYNGVEREGWTYKYAPETIAEFKNAIGILRKAVIYAQRIDWLHSADDNEEAFHKRLKEELDNL